LKRERKKEDVQPIKVSFLFDKSQNSVARNFLLSDPHL
jgi:hypothetical protein